MPEERKKCSHLTLDERHQIMNGLREHWSFAEMANAIGCSPDTISKEIRCHRYHKPAPDRSKDCFRLNYCAKKKTCRKRDVCNKKKGHKCKIPCRDCHSCNKLCPDFTPQTCKVVTKPPYVCNACPESKNCLLDKYLYNADFANREYQEKLHDSRKGIDMNKDELAALDELVSPLIKKGQPLAHIMQEHSAEISCSERTLYNYIDQGCLTARNIDMRRTVRYRKRHHYTEQPKISYKKKEGHHYEDFQKYMEEHPDTRVVEMDTVEGLKGGKMLQTFLWRDCNLMLAYLIDSKEMVNTVSVVNRLEECLGTETFQKMFPLILTDNGCEFADPELFETGKDGNKRTRLYFCEPRHSEQKGGLEKNHEYIRYVLPKKTSFDELSQEKVLLMINHINSTVRPKLHGSTPMKQALQLFGKDTLDKLGLEIVPADDVCLTPDLLK